jgi:hypothetical protein
VRLVNVKKKDFKDFKVTSVENTEKCFKTLTSRTKDGEEK